MQILAFVLTALALVFKTTASPVLSCSTTEAIAQSAYKMAFLITTKNYDALSEVWTKDIVYDSSDLGQYGGRTNGLESAIAATRRSGENANSSALVTNLLVLDMITPKKARVNT